MADKRYFTLDEARQALPRVREALGDAIYATHRLEAYKEQVSGLAEKAESNSGSPEGTAFLGHLLALQSRLNEIQQMGVLIKSVQEGLIDFPHRRAGREVYLCWRYGEEDIEFWHEVDAGFAGRQPIEESNDDE